MRRTTSAFALWNLILAHLQHSKFNIVGISHSPVNIWNASQFVCLHGWAISCALIFAQLENFLDGTLPRAIPRFSRPSQYVGNFNCQHVNRGYRTTSPEDESLVSWTTANNLELLHNPKGAVSFFSRRCNVGTNPYLAFASVGNDNRLPDRRVLPNFSRSQHRPSLITPPRLNISAYNDPVKIWNFCKAGWNRFYLLKENRLRDCYSGHNKHWESIPGTVR